MAGDAAAADGDRLVLAQVLRAQVALAEPGVHPGVRHVEQVDARAVGEVGAEHLAHPPGQEHLEHLGVGGVPTLPLAVGGEVEGVQDVRGVAVAVGSM